MFFLDRVRRDAHILILTTSLGIALVTALPAAGSSVAPQDRRDVRIGDVIAGSALWAEWSRRYVRPSGRVVDTAARGASHSEGQGYGMLLAVAAGDRAAFDRIWGWTQANLAVRLDNLFAWRWDPASRAVSDRNNATDGDILIAWALAEAADLWNAPAYADAGASIAGAIARHLVIEVVGVGPVLLPAHFGFAQSDQPDGPVVNLSYWVFPAFLRLAQLAPTRDWESVRRSGLAILDAIQSQAPARVGNWTALVDRKAAPARRFPAKAGYDAVRIPLYLAFAPRENVERLARFESMFPAGAPGVPIRDLRSGEADEMAIGRGYRALAALRACAIGGQSFPREFYWLGESEAYYPATLHALALIAALISNRQCFDPVEASHLQPFGWAPRVAADVSRLLVAAQVAVQPQQSARPTAAVPHPASVEDEDGAASGLLRIGAPLGAFLAIVGFIVVSRRSNQTVFLRDVTPAVLRERAPAPRHLPENPFHPAFGEHALEQRLDIAAKASWEWQRTAAVAYFRAPDYGDIVVADAQRIMTDMVAALSSCVRKSDAVSLLPPNQIVVCLSLIADDVDLASVGRRLTAALRAVRPMPAHEDNVFGLALYQMDGTGADCLAQAHRAFDTMNPPRGARAAKPAARRPRATAPRRKARSKTDA